MGFSVTITCNDDSKEHLKNISMRRFFDFKRLEEKIYSEYIHSAEEQKKLIKLFTEGRAI